MNTDQIIELISSVLSGNASPGEKQFLEQWIKESEENKAFYTEIKMLWDQSAGSTVTFEANTGKAWDKVAKATGIAGETKMRSIRTSSKNLFLRAAAVFVVLVGLGLVIYNLNSTPSIIQYSSNATEIIEIQLPDGSTVWLNKNSQLSYAKNFEGQTRELNLSGEAYFEVTKDANKPFIIHTGSLYTKVLGTSFNVQAYDSSLPVEVSVNSGTVELGMTDKNKHVILEKGSKGIASPEGEFLKTSIENENFIAWKTKSIVFSDVTLAIVFETIEHYFNIEVQADGAIMNCHFTGSFSDPDLHSLMNVIALSTGITYSFENNILSISGQPCMGQD